MSQRIICILLGCDRKQVGPVLLLEKLLGLSEFFEIRRHGSIQLVFSSRDRKSEKTLDTTFTSLFIVFSYSRYVKH